MKIEKINDNQIRCTLTREDLDDRQIKLSELAYGSEKARELFRDMMEQAAEEYGFEPGDIPILIEAIPLSAEGILLVITKVDNPEEMDKRFSGLMGRGRTIGEPAKVERADDILDLFKKLKEGILPDDDDMPAIETDPNFVPLSESLAGKKPRIKKPKTPATRRIQQQQEAVITQITKLYTFDSLSEVTRVAEVIKGFYHGENTLYHCSKDGKYYLFVKKSNHTPEEYNKLCNIFAEYANPKNCTPGVEAFFKEHEKLVIGRKALQVLTEL